MSSFRMLLEHLFLQQCIFTYNVMSLFTVYISRMLSFSNVVLRIYEHYFKTVLS